MENKILLLDSNSLMHRAYHALPNLKTSKGQYTGAIYGFLSILLRLIKEQQPTHIAAAFDLHGPTFRHKMYPAYKATRKPMDEELRQQVEPLKELIAMMGIKIVSLEGYEGDDILGTLSKRFEDECIIVTGDRDSFQLVSPTTKVFWTKRGVTEIEVYDEARLLEDGFTTAKFIDFKAMRGDPSDNIPGIPSVGEKTAKGLLDRYGSLEGVFEHESEIKGKIGETIASNHDVALLSRQLSIINTDVPVECTLEDIAFEPLYAPEVRERLTDLEMPSIAARMAFREGKTEREKMFFEKHTEEIGSVEAISSIKVGERVAVYIGDDILFATDSSTEYKVVCAEDLFGMNFDEALAAIKELTANCTLICYDYKNMRRSYGFSNAEYFDVMIAAHLARDSAPIKSAEAVTSIDGIGVGAAEIFREYEILKDKLTEKGLDKLFYDVELPLCAVLANMEERGVRVSTEVLDELDAKYGAIIEELEKKIYELAGVKFNISSPKQLGEVLFDKLGLMPGKRNRNGYSVNDEVLEYLIGRHPVIKYIREYRHYTKLRSTYVVGFRPLVTRGRIHTVYNQCITMTGRLSSTNPNLQNLPARSDEAKDIKRAFLPSEGNVLVSADYSQIELRLLAHMSGDEQLITAFKNNEDIHALTASQILGIPLEEVTPQQRRDAKAVNFGIVYGISGYGLAENLYIPLKDAADFIANYFKSHPKVKEYMEKCKSDARQRGYALTLLGRRRSIPDINASNHTVRSGAERMAMNTPLQGSAADIIKLAMIGVERRLEGMKSGMILQIHDELIIDAAPDEAEEVCRILSEEMQNAYKLNVPLVAEPTTAENWADLK